MKRGQRIYWSLVGGLYVPRAPVALWCRLLNYLQLVAGPSWSLVPVFETSCPNNLFLRSRCRPSGVESRHFCFRNPTWASLFDILLYRYSSRCSLYWLPIQWRINFNLVCLTFKATHNEVPAYLYRLIPYRPSRVLRSSFSSNLLQVPRTNPIFGSRSFHAAAPTVWNSLPDSIRSSDTLNSFRRHLKTHYFQAAFNTA